MSTLILSQYFINKIKTGHARRILSDAGCRGLYLDVRPNGKSFVLRYTDHAHRQKSQVIGNANIMSLKSARKIVRNFMPRDVEVASPLSASLPPKMSRKKLYRSYISERYLPFAFKTKRAAAWEEILFRCHLLPVLGDLPIKDISKNHIAALVNDKLNEGYAKGSVNRMIAIVKTSLTKAVEWSIDGMDRHPLQGFRTLRDPPKLERYLSPDENERLMKAVEQSNSPMLKFIIPFLLLTGARKREALDARWEHIDFDKCILTVPLSKSGKPRFIPLSSAVMTILSRARAEVAQHLGAHCPYIFPNLETGKPYISLFHSWNRVRHCAGLADVRMHDLRHSFASALVNRGATLYDVKEILGHANFTTTQRYAHLSHDRLMDAASFASHHYVNEMRAGE
jgi:integrase